MCVGGSKEIGKGGGREKRVRRKEGWGREEGMQTKTDKENLNLIMFSDDCVY